MGARQILRQLAGIAAALAASRAAVAAPAAGDALPVTIIDLRAADAASRAPSVYRLERELASTAALTLVADLEVRAQLAALAPAGEAALTRGYAALATARRASAADDCNGARVAAREAITALGAAQAAGAASIEPLVDAYGYQLRCAHEAGDRAAAARAAAALRAIGADAGANVPAAIWAAYPELDATANVALRSVEIAGEPATATVWIDHHNAGIAPLRAVLPEGEHLIALGWPSGGEAVWVSIRDDGQQVRVAHGQSLEARDARPATQETPLTGLLPWLLSTIAGDARGGAGLPAPADSLSLTARIAGWRRDPTTLDAAAMTEVMTAAEAQLGIVIGEGDTAALWALPPGSRRAQRIATAPLSQPRNITTPLVLHARQQRATPLLTGRSTSPEKAQETQPWWVYSAILGAVFVGAAVILATELDNDRQRIELTLP